MTKKHIKIIGSKIDLELLKEEDKEAYYKAGFEKPDKEIDYYTGNEDSFSKEQICAYFDKILVDETRYDFKILDKNGRLIGESVLNEIDEESRMANFRICLFESPACGKGFGTEAVRLTTEYGFESLHLHRIELEVYAFNERAHKAYKKCGYREEGIKRDGVYLGGKYHDVILMAALETDFE